MKVEGRERASSSPSSLFGRNYSIILFWTCAARKEKGKNMKIREERRERERESWRGRKAYQLRPKFVNRGIVVVVDRGKIEIVKWNSIIKLNNYCSVFKFIFIFYIPKIFILSIHLSSHSLANHEIRKFLLGRWLSNEDL